MEAFTRYANLGDDEKADRERLNELIQIQRSTVVSESGNYCTDVYSTDWRRNVDGRSMRVQYGHDLENVWLLIEAHRVLGSLERSAPQSVRDPLSECPPLRVGRSRVVAFISREGR